MRVKLQTCLVGVEGMYRYIRRPSMKRGVVVGMVVLLMLVGLGCFGFVFAEVGAKQKAPIRIAFNTWIGYSSFYIAEEKGFFKKRGIAVETKVIDPLAEKNAAMIRGDLDGMGGTIDSAVISATSGVKGKVVFMFDRSNGTDGILVTEEVKTVKDLKGVSV
jgi:NitT/TauT family transport system substrate-binding protein